MRLLGHPTTKYNEIVANTEPNTIWNFALFAMCNQQPVAVRMIELGRYTLLEWYLQFLSFADNGMRFNTVSNYLNIQVVQGTCSQQQNFHQTYKESVLVM